MDLFHTTDTDGISELNPTAKKMRALLDSLQDMEVQEADHPDVALVHDPSGWALAVYPSGVVTFENFNEPDEAPLYMKGVSRNQALELWLELSRGQIQQLKARPWQHDDS